MVLNQNGCKFIGILFVFFKIFLSILNHVQYGKNQFDYLVKWRELVYDQATWERDDFDIPLFEESVFRYWIHRFFNKILN